jgi:hypothetical protein
VRAGAALVPFAFGSPPWSQSKVVEYDSRRL